MKKIICLILFGLLSINVFPQSLADLERDPSFKGITIGAPISKYSNILTYSHVSEGKNVYLVKDSKYLSVFNVKMQDMIVVENEGKVYAIHLSKVIPSESNGFNVFNANELLTWHSNLKSKYGYNNVTLDDTSDIPMVCGMRWKTNTVVLDIVYLFYGAVNSEKSQLLYTLYQRKDDY